MKSVLLFILIFCNLPLCYAELYYCKDKTGKAIIKDSKCGSDEKLIKSMPSKEKGNNERIPDNAIIEDGKPGKLIFLDSKELSPPYKIKVHEVRIITETDDRLVVDVIYTYKHEIPAEEVKIFVHPNHSYWSANKIAVSNGKNVARASIGLSLRNMKRDYVRYSFTEILKVSFEHYSSKKYQGAIWSETVKYEKKWMRNDK